MTEFKIGDKVRLVHPKGTPYRGIGTYFDHPDKPKKVVEVKHDDLIEVGCLHQRALTQDVRPEQIEHWDKQEETNMTRYPFTITQDRISIFFEKKMHSVSRGDVSFEALKEELKKPTHNADAIRDCLDKPQMIARMTEGLVSVVGDEVHYDGEPLHNSLTSKLLRLLEDGFDIKPWARFLEKVMLNPSYHSRESLYNFLEHFETPITEDGDFLAFKRVRSDFKDIHSGTMDNSPGTVVEMPRHKVDDDSQRTCSAGLHACASNYLGSFYATSEGYKVVVVKINPRDVVAVPYDYQFSKMRVCRYEVIGEADEARVDTISKSSYYEWEYDYEETDDGDYDDYGYEPGDLDDFGFR